MVDVNYSTNSLFDAFTKVALAALQEKIKGNGGVIDLYSITLFMPQNKILTAADKKLRDRVLPYYEGDDVDCHNRESKSLDTSSTDVPNYHKDMKGAPYAYEKTHKELFKKVCETFKVSLMATSENEFYFTGEDACVFLAFGKSSARVEAFIDRKVWGAGKKIKKEDFTCNGKYDLVRQKSKEADNTVEISVVTVDGRGDINDSNMNLFVESFDTIKKNYKGDVGNGISELVKTLNDLDNLGKTIILSGQPGTGKSYLIKTLAYEIKKAFYPILIPQAEGFFGNANNYYNLISYFSNEERLMFIFEDAGMLFHKDARTERSQEVATMLNITDGLISSGREDIFLFTFNEKIEELDEAIVRPGRCMANIFFDYFTFDEGVDWLVKMGVDKDTATKSLEESMNVAGSKVTLANLYACLFEYNQVKAGKRTKAKLGFA